MALEQYINLDDASIDLVIVGHAARSEYDSCKLYAPSIMHVAGKVFRFEEQDERMLDESFTLGVREGLNRTPVMDVVNPYPGNPYAERFIGQGHSWGLGLVTRRD